MVDKKLDALAQMTAEHMAMPFPCGFRALDVEHQVLVILDADAYGYAVGVLTGPLNEQRRAGLTRLMAACEMVLPMIDDEYARRYYTHVRDMALLAAAIEVLREK